MGRWPNTFAQYLVGIWHDKLKSFGTVVVVVVVCRQPFGHGLCLESFINPLLPEHFRMYVGHSQSQLGSGLPLVAHERIAAFSSVVLNFLSTIHLGLQ